MTETIGEPLPQAQEPSGELRSAARCAEVLFLLFVLIVIATVALNRAISENKLEYRVRYQWYQDTGSMLARLRAFRDRNPSFFEGLVLSALTHWPPRDETREQYPSIAALSALGPVHFQRRLSDGSVGEFGGPSANYELLFELMSSASKFGALSAQIVSGEHDSARRTARLNAAVAETFTNEEARGFLEKTVVGPLSRIDDMAEWPVHTKCAWIVYGEWPPAGGIHGGPAHGITYLQRFLLPPDKDDEKVFICDVLSGTKDLTEVEKVLDAHWQEAYASVKSTPTGDPQIGVPGGGMSLRATDLVMLGGPILVVVQALFAVFWVRYWAHQMNQKQATTPFLFPAFASPVDPLDGPMPRTLADVTQRLTWLLCLVLPAAVLSFAIITRYDLSVFTNDWLPAGTPLLARVSSQRQYDSLSVLLDVINVFALVASLMAMIQITTANRVPTTVGSGTRTIRWAAVFVAFLLAASVWLWSTNWELYDTSMIGDYLRNSVYWVSFGLTWLLVLLVSFSSRARLPLVVSLFGLLLFFAMFIRT